MIPSRTNLYSYFFRENTIELHDCEFSNGENNMGTSIQVGDIIYSSGEVKVHGTRLNVITASDHVSLLQHSGEHWSIAVYDRSIYQVPHWTSGDEYLFL